jgi:hypothetical protein
MIRKIVTGNSPDFQEITHSTITREKIFSKNLEYPWQKKRRRLRGEEQLF